MMFLLSVGVSPVGFPNPLTLFQTNSLYGFPFWEGMHQIKASLLRDSHNWFPLLRGGKKVLWR
tara:strand:+ start:598 stop:786 length:189 start_codon:yes stop_codon:yes gene_type:complete